MDDNNRSNCIINNTENFQKLLSSPKRNKSILLALDSVHRSLLLKNLEFEQLTKIPNGNDELTLYESEKSFPSSSSLTTIDYTQHQTGEHCTSIVDELIDCDRLEIVDSDSDGLQACDNNDNVSMNFCSKPNVNAVVNQCNDEFKTKKLLLKVNVNRKYSCGNIPKDIMMHPKKDPSYHRSTDAKTASSSSSSTSTSSSYTIHNDSSIDEYYDCNDEKSFSSYYEDSVSNLNESHDSSPMIEIIQEITQQHTVRSTIHLNKNKIQKYRQSLTSVRISPNNNIPTTIIPNTNNSTNVQSKRRKSKQKSVRDNVHNEILDQHRDHSIDRDVTSDATTAGDDNSKCESESTTIRMGRLEGKSSRRSSKPVGRLITKRLERDRKISSKCRNDENGNQVPPLKPPRTFTATPSTTCSSKSRASAATDGNSSTTALIDENDLHRSTTIASKSANGSKQRIGWQLSVNNKSKSKDPSDDLNHIEWLCSEETNAKYGWTKPSDFTSSSSQQQQVYNMLNYEQCGRNKTNDMTSFNLLPEPQQRHCRPPPKESIDTVDFSAVSTPIKSPAERPLSIEEICQKCQTTPKLIDGFVRQSFKKNALKRTKSFFQASRRKISAKMPPSPYPARQAYSDSEDYRTPAKSETTERMNCSPLIDDSGKKSVKTLGFTPINYDCMHMVDSPIENNEQTPSQPPEKPIRRKYLSAPDNDGENIVVTPTAPIESNFDFQRTIHSPKRDSRIATSAEHLKRNFKLSPKRLFKTLGSKQPSTTSTPSKINNNNQDDKSYKSFVETDDDFIVLMGEYLRRMCRKIDGTTMADTAVDEVVSPQNFTSKPTLSHVSISSDTLAEPQIIEIDCHQPPTEPIYSEIQFDDDQSPPKHFCANNNPNAVYSIVNKLKPAVSCDSFNALNLGNDLSISIENILDQMILGGGMGVDCDAAVNDSVFCFAETASNDDRRRKCEREHMQQSMQMDVASMSTATSHLTECICDDVQQGYAVNDDIATMIERIETMDPFLRNSQQNKAVPEESDDDDAEYSDVILSSCAGDGIKEKLLLRPSLPPPPIPKHKTTNNQQTSIKSPSSAVIKNFTIKLRNSFSKGTNYIRTSMDKRKSIDCTPPSATKSQIHSPSSITRPSSSTSFNLRSAPSMIELSDMYMLQLNSQMTYQQEIRNQLKKAIDLCRNMNQFQCSTELVEAERLMLLSHKKEMAAKNELIRIDYDASGMQINPEKCCGNVTITDLTIDLKREAMYDIYFNYFYVAVCTYRDQVLATFARERNSSSDLDAIQFTNLQNMKFTNLQPDFKIQVEIYVLRLNKRTHADSSSMDKNLPSLKLTSPIKMLASLTGGSPAATTSSYNGKLKIDLDKSRFRLHGTTAITSFHLPSSRYVENCRRVYGDNPYLIYFASATKQFQCLLADKVHLDGSCGIGFNSEICLKNMGHRGFLSLAKVPPNLDASVAMLSGWTKWWSIVDGCKIYLWHEPDDQHRNMPPVQSLDLTKCTMDAIQLADKRTCSMPKTFILEMYNSDSSSTNNDMETFYLTTESNTDLIKWLTELNRILKFIKDWNI